MAGPLVISQMTSFVGSLVGSELIPIVATSAGSLTNFNISASGFAAFVLVNFPAQSPNTVLSGPAIGTAMATPAFRALVTSDIPLIPVVGGGTNTTTLTNNGVLYGQGTSTVGITPNAATGAILMSNGTNAGPSFQAAGTSGFALIANGATALPTYQLLNLTTQATGVITVPFGGTNTTTLTNNGVLYGQGTSTVGISANAATGAIFMSSGTNAGPAFQIASTAGLVLTSNGSNVLPTYQLVNLGNSTSVTGIVSVPNGGTNTGTLTVNGIVFGNGTSTVGITAAGGTSLPLLGQGANNAPLFGVTPVGGGGTNTTTLTAFGVIYGNGTSTVGITAAANSAQLLIGQTLTSAPTWQSVSGDIALTTNGVATIGNNAVTLAKFTQGTGLSVLGVSTTATANFTTIGSGGANQILAINNAATTLLWQSVSTTLDLAIGSTQGVLLTRNATTWIALAPGGVNSALVSQGAGANLAYTGLVAGGTVTSVGTGWGVTGGPITTLGTVSIATSNPPYGFDTAINLQLNASTSGSALTIAIKGNNGSDPSATNPVLFPFRDPTLANGDPVWRSATAALSLTINQTASLGAASGSPMRGWVTAHDTGTTPTIGVINCVVGMPAPTQVFPLAPNTLQTTTAISNAAVTAGVYYSAVGVNNKPFLILGYFEYANITTAGQWTNTPTQLQLFGPGIKKPGDSLQVVQAFTTGSLATGTTTFTSATLSASITPTSASNPVMVSLAATLGQNSATGGGLLQMFRGVAGTGVGPILVTVGAANLVTPAAIMFVDAPATTGATTYVANIRAQAAGTALFLGSGFGDKGYMYLTELMG